MLLHNSEKLYLMFCMCCAQVSVIDDGLLKFSKLEELVLSANKISEIPAENLPSTLKVSLSPAPACSAANQIKLISLVFPAFPSHQLKTPAVTSLVYICPEVRHT